MYIYIAAWRRPAEATAPCRLVAPAYTSNMRECLYVYMYIYFYFSVIYT